MLTLRLRDPGRLGSEARPGTEPNPGTAPADGRLGSEGLDGRLGSGSGQARDRSGQARDRSGQTGRCGHAGGPSAAAQCLDGSRPCRRRHAPARDTVTGLAIDGAAGVLMHCGPEGTDGGDTGSEVRLGTDVGATALWVAALETAFATTAATAASPAAPATSRIIRPKRGMFPLCVVRTIGLRWDREGGTGQFSNLAAGTRLRHGGQRPARSTRQRPWQSATPAAAGLRG